MVQTRYQERLKRQTPPSEAKRTSRAEFDEQQHNDANYATPPPLVGVTLADGRRIKSALKSQSRLRPSGGEDPDAEVFTPSGAGIKKRVRIRSKDNMVHVFERSLATEDVDFGDDDDAPVSRLIDCDRSTLSDRDKIRHDIESIKRDMLIIRRGLYIIFTSNFALAAYCLLGWALSSSWLIFFMKDLMTTKGLPFALSLPAISQLGAAGMAWSLSWLGIVEVRPWPPAGIVVRRLVPLALSCALSMFLGNFAYLGLSISFLSMLKALTPAVVLLLSAASGTEEFTGIAFLSTLLIAYGTGVATIQETVHNASFHWPAFISFTTSILFEGLRVTFVARLVGGYGLGVYSPIEVMAQVGPLVFVFMGFAGLIVEREAILELGPRMVSLIPELALVCVLSFLVNVTSYLSIHYTSSTTFKVAGCFKNVAVLWLSTSMGDVVTRKQLQGFALSTGGFLLYTWARARTRGNAKRSRKGR